MIIERSEGDLEFLANWELTNSSAPPKSPEESENPEIPPETLPDPNVPDAPESVTIIENGVPTTYRKVRDPETGKWIYILEEDVPLHRVNAPETGDNGVLPWALLSILSISGLAAIYRPQLFQNRRKKKNRY